MSKPQIDIPQEEKEQILKTFFKDNKLDQIPSKQSKKLVVLEKVATFFEDEKEYSEFEVTKILKPLCSDFCTIRRDLVDNGFFVRENGVYKKVK